MLLKVLISTLRFALRQLAGILVKFGWADEVMRTRLVEGILEFCDLAWDFRKKALKRTVPGGPFNPHAEVRKATKVRRP